MAAVMASVMILSTTKVATKQSKEAPPAVVEAVAPAYPRIAATAGAAGTVTIEVQIRADGTVSSTRVIKGVGVLAAAARISARRWIFSGTSDGGARVVPLTFVFRIMPPNTRKDELLPIFMPPYRVELRAILPEVIDSVNRDSAIPKSRKRNR